MPREFLAVSHEAVVDVVERRVTALEALDGADVVSVELDVDLSRVLDAASVVIAAEAAWLIWYNGVVRGQGLRYDDEWRAAFLRLKENGFSEHVASCLLLGAYLDEATAGGGYEIAQSVARSVRDAVWMAFRDVDALLTPTMRIPPPDPR